MAWTEAMARRRLSTLVGETRGEPPIRADDPPVRFVLRVCATALDVVYIRGNFGWIIRWGARTDVSLEDRKIFRLFDRDILFQALVLPFDDDGVVDLADWDTRDYSLRGINVMKLDPQVPAEADTPTNGTREGKLTN